jgi:ketosteroid isomerase-like protein
MEGTPKAAGTPPLREEGKFLEVLRRQADGTWRYAADMWSPNDPPRVAR